MDSGIAYSEKSLAYSKKIKYKQGEADAYLAMSVGLEQIGLVKQAIAYQLRCLKISEEINSRGGIMTSYGNLGSMLADQNQFEKAEYYYFKQLKLLKPEDPPGMKGDVMLHLAEVYKERKQLDKADSITKISLEFYTLANDKRGIARVYYVLGGLRNKQGRIAEEKQYYEEALKIYNEIDYKKGQARAHLLLAEWYFDSDNFQKAESHSMIALKIAKNLGMPDRIEWAALLLYKIYKRSGDYKNALDMHELHTVMYDSINNEGNKRAMMEQNLQYEFNKKQALDEENFKREKEIKNIELRKGRNLQVATSIILLLALSMAGGTYINLRKNKKKNDIIAIQKKQVEEKNLHILQNITHAQKIQQAILPQDRLVAEWLSGSFVLYQPKDIVSGDFYFMDSRNNNVYFAALDCTGHGVSGAFVSIIGHAGLKRTIDEFKLSQPADMLQKLNELVVETLKQESGPDSLPDGMDIALCRLNVLKNELLFAGAKRPLWLIRKGELHEYEGNRKSIGGMKYEEDRNKEFKQHRIKLEQGDVFYIFTDGLVDQFGHNGKKLLSKRLRDFLLSIHHLPIPDQRNRLSDFINQWRGHEEQTDDICVIGVRV